MIPSGQGGRGATPRILILKTGETALEVRRAHGDYDRWFIDAMTGLPAAFDVCDVTRAPIPPLDPYAGVLITGSVKSVYEQEAWMEPLAEFLRGAGSAGRPTLGVCFGCQMLAQARGGRVVLNPEGWEIGAVEVDLVREACAGDPLFGGLVPPDSSGARGRHDPTARLPVLATHRDRIETLPPGAVRLAGNANTLVQAFRAAGNVWGVQFHPEATPAILRELILLRRDRLEADVRARGTSSEGRIERLIADLERFDVAPARRLLASFVSLCAEG